MRSDFFEKFFLEERADILARGRVENVENVAEFISFFVSNDEQPRPLLLRWRITAATFSSIHFRVSLSIDTSLSLSLSLSLYLFLPSFLSFSFRSCRPFFCNESIHHVERLRVPSKPPATMAPSGEALPSFSTEF